MNDSFGAPGGFGPLSGGLSSTGGVPSFPAFGGHYGGRAQSRQPDYPPPNYRDPKTDTKDPGEVLFWRIVRVKPEWRWDPKKKRKVEFASFLDDLPASQFTVDKIAKEIRKRWGGGSYDVWGCNYQGKSVTDSSLDINDVPPLDGHGHEIETPLDREEEKEERQENIMAGQNQQVGHTVHTPGAGMQFVPQNFTMPSGVFGDTHQKHVNLLNEQIKQNQNNLEDRSRELTKVRTDLESERESRRTEIQRIKENQLKEIDQQKTELRSEKDQYQTTILSLKESHSRTLRETEDKTRRELASFREESLKASASLKEEKRKEYDILREASTSEAQSLRKEISDLHRNHQNKLTQVVKDKDDRLREAEREQSVAIRALEKEKGEAVRAVEQSKQNEITRAEGQWRDKLEDNRRRNDEKFAQVVNDLKSRIDSYKDDINSLRIDKEKLSAQLLASNDEARRTVDDMRRKEDVSRLEQQNKSQMANVEVQLSEARQNREDRWIQMAMKKNDRASEKDPMAQMMQFQKFFSSVRHDIMESIPPPSFSGGDSDEEKGETSFLAKVASEAKPLIEAVKGFIPKVDPSRQGGVPVRQRAAPVVPPGMAMMPTQRTLPANRMNEMRQLAQQRSVQRGAAVARAQAAQAQRLAAQANAQANAQVVRAQQVQAQASQVEAASVARAQQAQEQASQVEAVSVARAQQAQAQADQIEAEATVRAQQATMTAQQLVTAGVAPIVPVVSQQAIMPQMLSPQEVIHPQVIEQTQSPLPNNQGGPVTFGYADPALEARFSKGLEDGKNPVEWARGSMNLLTSSGKEALIAIPKGTEEAKAIVPWINGAGISMLTLLPLLVDEGSQNWADKYIRSMRHFAAVEAGVEKGDE